MARRYCNFTTGNDTTGDGSIGNPYKTIAKGVTVTSLGDTLCVMADELITSKIVLNSLSAGYTYTEIIGVNDAGVEDGTRRKIYGATVDYIFQITGGNNYSWRISNFEWSGFSEHVFQITNAAFGSVYSNFKITGGKGMFSASNNSTAIIEDFEMYGCSGNYPIYYNTGKVRRGIFRNCVMGNSYVIYAVNYTSIRDIIISGCSCSGNDYALFYAPFGYIDNIIVDRCLISGLKSNFAWSGYHSNILLTHITFTGATARSLFRLGPSAPTSVHNLNMFDIVGDPTLFTPLTNASFITKNINTLTESPYLVDDGENYALRPGYFDRRKKQELSAYSGLWEARV